MCGITGIIYSNKDAKPDATEAACRQMSLRGPDGHGVKVMKHVCLGHRRLSIIDPSVIANQPMLDPAQNYCLVFNGEIFNFKELKASYLHDKNIQFLTHSDTEVLLYLLIHYGVECLSWLDGFFAFAFHDIKNNSLLLARDRFGKKPLLYSYNNEFLAFASEMKALLQYDIPRNINYQALKHFFQFTYVPQTESIFHGVEKLQAGHYLIIKDHQIKIEKYFTLAIREDKYSTLNYEQAQEKLRNLLDLAVEKRLISDVPLGAFLSGGVDSSTVVALASQHTKHLNTFSIGYTDNPYYDETAYAQLVSKKFDTEHTIFSISNNDYLEVIDDLLNYIDEPYADASSIPLYILSKRTKNAGMTVALSGDGGDELFAGYNKHYAEYKLRNPGLAAHVISALHPLWKIAPQGRSSGMLDKFRQLYKFSSNSKLDMKSRYLSLASFDHHPELLFTPEVRTAFNAGQEQIFRSLVTKDLKSKDLNEFLLSDFNFVLYNDMLVKVDQMGMANSLEIRSPFLDKDLVDFAFEVPIDYKLGSGIKKKIVQDAFRKILPEELYNRPKRGFEIPLNSLLQKELWHKIDTEILDIDFIRSQKIFDAAYIEKLKKKMHTRHPGDTYITIWCLIVFQTWYKKYMQ